MSTRYLPSTQAAPLHGTGRSDPHPHLPRAGRDRQHCEAAVHAQSHAPEEDLCPGCPARFIGLSLILVASLFDIRPLKQQGESASSVIIGYIYGVSHSLNMELDLQSLFWLHVHSCTHSLTPQLPPFPRIWAHIRGQCCGTGTVGTVTFRLVEPEP